MCRRPAGLCQRSRGEQRAVVVDWCLVAWHGSTWLVGPVEWEKLGDDGLRGPALWQLLSRKRKGNGFDFLVTTRKREIVHRIEH